jgi:enterochelin esterase family protein
MSLAFYGVVAGALALMTAGGQAAPAQTPPSPSPPPPVVSPEVLADGRVTFRLRAPGAKDVLLAREGAEPAPMQKDDQGVWSLTTAPLPPDYYGYSFTVDGVTFTDPSNHRIKPNFIWRASEVHVPGPASLPWEVGTVPRGVLHRHFYRSTVVGDDRDFYVYTPPGYDAGSKDGYPVLYLLHGFSDDASGWTAVGRAHVILDNLIAQGKARPMLVVMPLGYGAPEILSLGFRSTRDPGVRQRNIDSFREALLVEVIPEVERAYRAAQGRDSRAIAGLSMGGGQSLATGLHTLDRFSWIGAFSSGLDEDFAPRYQALDAKANAQVRLLWIACGTEDRLLEVNRKFHQLLEGKQIRHTWIETPGGHTWMVWRRNLAAFVPLIFR